MKEKELSHHEILNKWIDLDSMIPKKCSDAHILNLCECENDRKILNKQIFIYILFCRKSDDDLKLMIFVLNFIFENVFVAFFQTLWPLFLDFALLLAFSQYLNSAQLAEFPRIKNEKLQKNQNFAKFPLHRSAPLQKKFGGFWTLAGVVSVRSDSL